VYALAVAVATRIDVPHTQERIIAPGAGGQLVAGFEPRGSGKIVSIENNCRVPQEHLSTLHSHQLIPL
jgi:hypothetical protein